MSRTYYDVGVELIFQEDTVVIKQEMARPGIHRWEISIGADKKRFFVFNPLITRYVELLLPPRLRKDYYYSREESIMREYFKGG